MKSLVHISFSLGAAVLLFASITRAASSPELMITWRAASLAPASFPGKLLPTANTPIVAALTLIDGGTIINLSQKTIYWYVNDDFVAGGVGVRQVTFRAPNFPAGTIDVRAELPGYGAGGVTLKTIEIPVVPSEAVIEAPFPNGTASLKSIHLVGQPYFFNAARPTNLVFSWNVNGESPTGSENPQALTINLPDSTPNGYGLSISLSIKDPSGGLLAAAQSALSLTVVR